MKTASIKKLLSIYKETICFPYDSRIQQVSCLPKSVRKPLHRKSFEDFGANKTLADPTTVKVKSANWYFYFSVMSFIIIMTLFLNNLFLFNYLGNGLKNFRVKGTLLNPN